jgi:4-alpha-glucanotransferase
MSLNGGRVNGAVQLALQTEDGEVSEWSAGTPEKGDAVVLPPLPMGYHRLSVSAGGRSHESLVIAAPDHCAPFDERAWGVFIPLYALRRQRRDQGVGNLNDLMCLMSETMGRGGRTVATLPLFATFTGASGPFEPSPYAPVSRLFWNELFLDINGLPGARRRVPVSPLERNARRQTAENPEMVRLVDYRRVAAAVHGVLDDRARTLMATPSRGRDAFERWRRSRPDVAAYARFRAAIERRGNGWRAWPARMRNGHLRSSDVDPAVELRHLFAQWAFERQLDAVVRMGRSKGSGWPQVDLAFDLPLGVHPDGFDAWREREVMVEGANAGAPPDRLFTKGQDWGFAPLHPERVREDGYRYPIACLRALMSRARFLRLDHVMALHRLFFVPHGMPATAGTYVRYRPEEWYAILALESQRSGCVIVGEDLGTVPRLVRHAMRRHGVLRSYVTELELWPGNDPPLAEPPRASVASLNTHDLAAFAGYLEGKDIDDRRRIGLIDEATAARAHAERSRLLERFARVLHRRGLLDETDDMKWEAFLRAALSLLASSEASLVTVNLEDLWGERLPQNIPGTGPEEPNWRRRAALTLEEAFGSETVLATLRMLNDLRSRDAAPAGSVVPPTP